MACILLLSATMLLETKDASVQQTLLDILNGDTADGDAESDPDAAQEADTSLNLAALYAENEDFIGWICIEGTEINYPVMHTPTDAEYYLHRDFYGDYSFAGTIFASYDSSFAPRSDNVILYGHNMNNGSMFADLLNYTAQSYWQEHQTIQFDTLSGAQTYEIVYAFAEDIGIDNPHFELYDFLCAASETEFNDFIASCKERSLYATVDDPVYGDNLLTLVTCKGYDTTERMVIVAKAVEEETA